jgi:hypothetical protein
MSALNVIQWVAFAIGLYLTWYTRRSLDKAATSLDVSLAAFDAALVARTEARELHDSAIEQKKATLALLKETRRVLDTSSGSRE